MARLGFYFNQDNCVGCRACQVACKDAKDLPVGVLFRHVKTYETGSFPKPGLYHYSHNCNHCSTPACLAICPTEAFIMAEDGTIQLDKELCIGCKKCIDACPYGVPQYLESEAVVGKCDSCADLRGIGENPPCVDACNMRVLEFGDIDELTSKHSGETLSIDLPFLPDPSITLPPTLVKARACALESSFTEHPEV